MYVLSLQRLCKCRFLLGSDKTICNLPGIEDDKRWN